MFSYYKKFLFTPVFYLNSPEGASSNEEKPQVKEEKSAEPLSQDKLTPEAKEELQNTTEWKEAEVATIIAETQQDLAELKQSIENSSSLEAEVSNIISNIELKNDATLKIEDGQVRVFSKDWVQVRYFTIENWKEEETFVTDGKYDQQKIQDWANFRVDEYLQKIWVKDTHSQKAPVEKNQVEKQETTQNAKEAQYAWVEDILSDLQTPAEGETSFGESVSKHLMMW